MLATLLGPYTKSIIAQWKYINVHMKILYMIYY